MPLFTLNKKLGQFFVHCMIFAVLWCTFICSPVQAARAQFNENQVKAIFLFNLANFVFWPEDSFTNPNDPFLITILGKDQFGKTLNDIIKNEKIGQHPIIIKRIKSIDALETTHILFIHRSLANDLEKIMAQVVPSKVLTVSDYPKFTAKGGAISLLVHKNRLILELNAAATHQTSFKISSKLLQIAKIVGKISP